MAQRQRRRRNRLRGNNNTGPTPIRNTALEQVTQAIEENDYDKMVKALAKLSVNRYLKHRSVTTGYTALEQLAMEKRFIFLKRLLEDGLIDKNDLVQPIYRFFDSIPRGNNRLRNPYATFGVLFNSVDFTTQRSWLNTRQQNTTPSRTVIETPIVAMLSHMTELVDVFQTEGEQIPHAIDELVDFLRPHKRVLTVRTRLNIRVFIDNINNNIREESAWFAENLAKLNELMYTNYNIGYPYTPELFLLINFGASRNNYLTLNDGESSCDFMTNTGTRAIPVKIDVGEDWKDETVQFVSVPNNRFVINRGAGSFSTFDNLSNYKVGTQIRLEPGVGDSQRLNQGNVGEFTVDFRESASLGFKNPNGVEETRRVKLSQPKWCGLDKDSKLLHVFCGTEMQKWVTNRINTSQGVICPFDRRKVRRIQLLTPEEIREQEKLLRRSKLNEEIQNYSRKKRAATSPRDKLDPVDILEKRIKRTNNMNDKVLLMRINGQQRIIDDKNSSKEDIAAAKERIKGYVSQIKESDKDKEIRRISLEIRNKQGLLDDALRRIEAGNLSNIERVQYRQEQLDQWRNEIRELLKRQEEVMTTNDDNNNNASSSSGKKRRLRFKF